MSDTVSTLAQKLRPFWLRDLGATTPASTGGSGMVTHALNGPYHTGTLDPSQAPWALTSTRTITAGAGLTGGGDLSADISFAVGAGAGITVNADDVALTTPGTLTVSSTNTATGSHTHAITSSSNPGAAASLLATTAAGLLTLQNGAFVQAAQSNDTFATGFAGSGWRADYGVTTASRASIETDDLTVRGRMRVYELLIQQIRATNGSVFVSSASKVVSVSTSTNPLWTVNGVQLKFNGSNATLTTTLYTITTAAGTDTDGGSNDRRLYHGFLYGDLIRAQQVRWDGAAFAGMIQSNLEVTGVVNLYTYQAALVSGDAAAAGYDYVRLGNTRDTTRQGSIYLTSDDSAAPFMDIVDGVSSFTHWNSTSVARVRVGKLTGISDAAFGGTLSGYGLYGNNVYLRGQIVVTGGSLGGLAAADVNSNTTTINGGQITTGSITASQIAASTITGDRLSLTTDISIKSSTWQAQGVQFQYNGGTPRFYVGTGGVAPGTPTAKYITFDGSEVEIRGTVDLTGGVVSGPMSTTGSIYAGNAAVRLSTDGVRLVLPNLGAPNLKTTIPSSSSAVRWMASITDAWSNSLNYTGMIGYRDTTNKVIDFVQMSYVGSTDYATYHARSMLYANRYNGSTDKECRLEATVDPGTGGAYVTATCDTFYTSVDAYIGDDIYIVDNCSALTFTDRTPYFDGDALAQLRPVRGKTRTVKGKAITEIDHSSIPAFARKQVRDLKTGEQRDERDLGAMISLLTAAVQQLDARLDALEGRGNGNR